MTEAMTDSDDDGEIGTNVRVIREVIGRRFTCRSYCPERVPRATIEAILKIAQMAPSWCNTQPWHLLITEGEATTRFADALFQHAAAGAQPTPDFPFPESYEGVYKTRRRAVAEQLYAALGIALHDRAASHRQTLENFRLFGAPHAAIVTTDRKLGLYGAVDCGVYIGNLMLAAASHGVATTPQAALAVHGAFVRDHFKIAADRAVLCGMSFGWPNRDHPANGFRAPRASLSEAVEFRQ